MRPAEVRGQMGARVCHDVPRISRVSRWSGAPASETSMISRLVLLQRASVGFRILWVKGGGLGPFFALALRRSRTLLGHSPNLSQPSTPTCGLFSAPAPTRTGDLQVRSLRTAHTLPISARRSPEFPRRTPRVPGGIGDGWGDRPQMGPMDKLARISGAPAGDDAEA